MLRSRKPGSYEEALIHLKQVHNANCHHLVINHKLKLTILTKQDATERTLRRRGCGTNRPCHGFRRHLDE